MLSCKVVPRYDHDDEPTTACQTCAAGNQIAKTPSGKDDCVACSALAGPSVYYDEDTTSATKCTECKAGNFWDKATNPLAPTCKPCKAGEYSRPLHNAPCPMCPV